MGCASIEERDIDFDNDLNYLPFSGVRHDVLNDNSGTVNFGTNW